MNAGPEVIVIVLPRPDGEDVLVYHVRRPAARIVEEVGWECRDIAPLISSAQKPS